MGCTNSKAAGGEADAQETKENRKIEKAQRKAAEEAASKIELLILGEFRPPCGPHPCSRLTFGNLCISQAPETLERLVR